MFFDVVPRVALPLGLCFGLLGCTGAIGGALERARTDNEREQPDGEPELPAPTVPIDDTKNPPMPVAPDACESASRMGPAPLRRLTNVELANSLRDLLQRKEGLSLLTSFPKEGTGHGFDNNADTSTIPRLRVQRMIDAAETAAAAFDASKLLACPVDAITDDCLREFITGFAGRAYRRPPNPDEIASLVGLYRGLGSENLPREKLATVVQAILLSPQFNFMMEFGDPNAPSGESGHVGLSGHELATRLSYFLWSSMPDAELFRAAAAGDLGDPETLGAQVKRMLDDPRAREGMRNFVSQWLDYDRLDQNKDTAIFRNWNAALATDLKEELSSFFEVAAIESPDGWSRMMTDTNALVTARTAAIYGIDAPPGGAAQKTPLPDVRPGFLTRAGFLAGFAQAKFPSPIQRGTFIRREFLCQELGSPPPGAETAPAPVLPVGATNRQIKEAHSQNPECVSCHRYIDPPGFALEAFDAIGTHRLMEQTDTGGLATIDTSGELMGTDVDGAFLGAKDLVGMLARSAQAQSCVVKQWFRFARGRLDGAGDECTISDLTRAFNSSGGDFHVLFAAMASHPSFRHRPQTTNN